VRLRAAVKKIMKNKIVAEKTGENDSKRVRKKKFLEEKQ
jgi:hypothetical protein